MLLMLDKSLLAQNVNIFMNEDKQPCFDLDSHTSFYKPRRFPQPTE